MCAALLPRIFSAGKYGVLMAKPSKRKCITYSATNTCKCLSQVYELNSNDTPPSWAFERCVRMYAYLKAFVGYKYVCIAVMHVFTFCIWALLLKKNFLHLYFPLTTHFLHKIFAFFALHSTTTDYLIYILNIVYYLSLL